MKLDDMDFQIEDISADEADRAVRSLMDLRKSVKSVTIREFLEECAMNIHFLVHDDEIGEFTAAA
jgi:hypothetical protein